MKTRLVQSGLLAMKLLVFGVTFWHLVLLLLFFIMILILMLLLMDNLVSQQIC